MKQLTVRLGPGQLLKEEIERLAVEHDIQAGVILSIVGGVENINLRVPRLDSGEHVVKELVGPFELVSCTGTVSRNGCHIHVSVSDRQAQVFGGHLKDGARVFFTVELVIGIFDEIEYQRLPDEQTGCRELTVKSLTR